MLLPDHRLYNYHSHTQFCDGKASMEEMADSASKEGFLIYGFTPHAPISVESPCNMNREDVDLYLETATRLKEKYSGKMEILTGMEIDYLSPDFGPHIDYFQNLPLDYRLASVHFVPSQDGEFIDCDGRFERFERNLRERFHSDLRYVVEKYFENVLMMIERGGFDILGHFDKIAGNASKADSGIENEGWYGSLVDDVISHAASADIIVEINTKAFQRDNRFFPASRWWEKLLKARIPLVVNSDAHQPDKITAGRSEAFRILDSLSGRD